MLLASSLACLAFSAFFFTVEVISSIDAEVSSRLAACSSVRCDRSVVLVEISAEAFVTSRPDDFIPTMVELTSSAIRRAALMISPISSFRPKAGKVTVKSPSRKGLHHDSQRGDGLQDLNQQYPKEDCEHQYADGKCHHHPYAGALEILK